MTGTLYRGSRPGLTLLELLVVVALMALVTATVTTRLSGMLGPAALGQAVSQWEFADQQLRMRARRSGRSTALHVEIGTNRLECAFAPEDEDRRTVRTLGRGVRVSEYISAAQEVTHGPLSIHYDDRGASETFAIEFVSGHSRRRWLIVAGVTGQVTEIENEAAARQILELLAPPRLHAG